MTQNLSPKLSQPARRLRLTTALTVSIVVLGALAGLQGCGGSSNSGGGTTPPPTPPVTTPLSVTSSNLPGATVGATYGAILTATGGSGTGYTWSVASGSLPAGITLSSGGNLAGTPTAAGNATFKAAVADSAGNTASASLSIAVTGTTPLSNYDLTGDTSPVHDPSIIRQGSTYYVFVTDAGPAGGFLPIRCSPDRKAWTACGYVFSALPSWVAGSVPAATNLWAPDISYFNGLYHLYYAASSFGSQTSGIGLATTPTLDATDPSYKWTDQGAILTSSPGANFNAIDPNILVDTDGAVYLTYGSYWNGIFQQKINPGTGKIIPGTPVHLAERAASVQNDPEEGASLIHKGNYYYLFASWDACCNPNPATDNYKIAMGRGTTPQGPFLDQAGIDMVGGGGSILLAGDETNWIAPGGETAYTDATGGDLIVFHALSVQQNYLDLLFVRALDFSSGWPVLSTSTVTAPNGIGTATTLTAAPNPATAGAALSLTAVVAPVSGSNATGSVTFFAGSVTIGSCTLDGTGSCTLTSTTLAPGTYSITALYMGNAVDAESRSSAVSVTVQAGSTAIGTSVVVTSATASIPQGIPVALHASVTPASGAAIPTGSVTFAEGGTTLYAAPLDTTGIATLNTEKLAVGQHAIVANYSGSANLQAATSAPLALTIVSPGAATYTNPVAVTDANLGAVSSCPDPAIIKSQAAGVDTWYLYCTGDAHNSRDLTAGSLNFNHLLSIYQSADLVSWTSVGDALTSLPAWSKPGAQLWAPAIKFLNGKFYLYYIVTATSATGSSAIGVATSASAAGPFVDSGTPVVQPEAVRAGMDGAGQQRWIFDPDVIADSSGQLYILFGSFQGGISVRKLSADGLTSDPATETQIAADQRYEGGAWLQHGGYFYLLVSATNCCAGPLTGYGVFAGRAATPMGPYLDQQGHALSDINVGGSPVLAMNGNSLIGPGGGSPFTDEAGQDYYAYHEVQLRTPYYAGTLTTARPAAIDAIDWVNGWPVVRGGYGPSDASSPQPKPVAQPGGTAAYHALLEAIDTPAAAIAGLSQDFNTSQLNPQWSSIHSAPAYSFTGSALTMPTVAFDTTNAMASIPILSEATPAGDYMVEVKLTVSIPDDGSLNDFAQAGLLLYKDDANYLRADLYSNSDTRQVEFIKGETPEGSGYPTWSATDLGPATSISGTLGTWLRVVKRTVDGQDTYTGYNSTDGTTWVRCGAWTANLGSNAQIGLYAGNRAGYTASFDYVHVSTVK